MELRNTALNHLKLYRYPHTHVGAVEGGRDGPLVEGGVYGIKLSTVATVYAA